MKTNFKIFGFIFILFISATAYSMESTIISENMHIQAFLNSINLTSWLDTPTDASTMLRVLKIFKLTTAKWLNNNEIWVNQAPKETIANLISGKIKVPLHLSSEGYFLHIPNIPYLAKWVIPQDNHVTVIGDLHGNFDALKEIIKAMQLDSHIKIIFLGDLMDRGDSSLKVFTTAALLALKYPGQVLIIRGNHEYIDANLDIYGLESEIRAIGASDETIYGIEEELSKAYAFLPVGVFVGHQGPLPTRFIFHVHGCVDIRINCKDLLESDATNLSQNSGIRLWKFGPENIIKKPKDLIEFYKDIVPNLDDFMKDLMNVTEALTNPNPIAGLLWNDISYKSNHLLNVSSRGADIINLDIEMVKMYLENYNSDNVKVCGMIRGHQHVLPKDAYKILHQELIGSMCKELRGQGTIRPEDLKKKLDLSVCRKITPACFVSFQTNTGNRILLMENCAPMKFDNNFWITTLMSASIIESQEIQILYPPTFLRFMFNQSAGQHEVQAVFNTALLQN